MEDDNTVIMHQKVEIVWQSPQAMHRSGMSVTFIVILSILKKNFEVQARTMGRRYLR